MQTGRHKITCGLFFLGLFAVEAFVIAGSGGLAAGSGDGAHWGYEGMTGPLHWGAIDPAFRVCGDGTRQSPIDIATTETSDLENIIFQYQEGPAKLVNNGHSVQADLAPGGYIEVGGKRFEAVQFHYHTPSEHAVDGSLFPAEFHIVHKTADGELAVVGVLIQEGAPHPGYATFVGNLPDDAGKEGPSGIMLSPEQLLPEVRTCYRYSGSLTTPPCTEGVSWLVLTQAVELSSDQLEGLAGVFAGNNRPVQAMHGRKVEEDITP